MEQILSKTALSMALALALGLTAAAPAVLAESGYPLISSVSQRGGDVPSLAPMLKKAIPAVVNISVKGTKEVSPLFNIPEEFRFMFPGNNFSTRQRQFRALGSGVIIDAGNGYVVTNSHVVDGASDIRIALSDGREFNAVKKGEDPHTDLALLQLKDFSNLTQLDFANSDELEVGDFAIAIGNPFGLGQTVTSGIISALGRSGLNIENVENFIQTDAAINTGNSGGALINLKGYLIGINTAILGPNGGNIGIGFAIPSSMVQTVINQLIRYGEVKRGALGVTGTELNSELAENFGYQQSFGAFVNEVTRDGPAHKAGIRSGDIITRVNGRQISSFGELRARIATLGAGTQVTITVFRDGRELDIPVTLEQVREVASNDAKDISESLAGASLANHSDGGVEVTRVDPRSQAQALGLKKGDVILGINRSRVRNITELRKLLSQTKGRLNALQIRRNDATLYITIR